MVLIYIHYQHMLAILCKSVFGPLKIFFDIDDRWISIVVESAVLIQTVMHPEVFERVFAMHVIVRGWRETGLHPFNMNAVPHGSLSADKKDTTILNAAGKVYTSLHIVSY
jgi:hypothetical protein